MNANELHVIFGTGPLGLAVMRELVNRGKRVRMVNRSGKASVPAGVEVVAKNAYDAGQVRDVTQGAAVVYQCAQPGYTQWETEFPPLQAAIIEGVTPNGVKLVIGENLYMYGDVDRALTEDLPYAAHTRKGKIRAAMAEAALAAHRSGKLRVTIGRASDFYGAGVFGSALGDRVFYPALAGKAAQVAGNIDTPHTYTYIDDFGKGLVVLGEHDEAFGRAWHVPSGETLTTRQILTMIYEELGQPPKFSVLSKMMMRIGGLFIPAAREMVEMMYEFEKPFVVDHSQFARAFGDHSTPHRDAIRATLAWFRANPQVKAA